MDCSLPGSSIHGIFQARVLERGATAFSEALSYPVSTPSEWRKWSVEWYQDLLALITAVSLSGLAQSQLLLLLPSHFSRVRLLATPWTVVHQAPLSMGFSRQEDWSGLPCPPPGDLPDSGIEPDLLHCR